MNSEEYKKHPLWLALEAKRVKEEKPKSVFEGLITEYRYGQVTKVL